MTGVHDALGPPARSSDAEADAIKDSELLQAFEDGSLPAELFHHANHVRAAWTLLCEVPPLDALQRFSIALRRYATNAGKPNLYHETITWAFFFLIHERMRRLPIGDWGSFAGENPDLLTWRPSILDHYYRTETLQSDFARRVFLMPDLP